MRIVAYKHFKWTGKIVEMRAPGYEPLRVKIDGVAIGNKLTGRVVGRPRERWFFQGASHDEPGLPSWVTIVEPNKLPKWWWMSFVDMSKPEGSRFVGVCIVPGLDLKDALVRSHISGCNPGGDVKAAEIPDDISRHIPPNRQNVLLSALEARLLGEEVDAAMKPKN